MPWEILHFFANLVEVIVALAAILAVALLITMAGLWIFPKMLNVTEEPLADSDLDQDEEFIPSHPEMASAEPRPACRSSLDDKKGKVRDRCL
jgi:hypothetical protein